jgi:hypothetical protein
VEDNYQVETGRRLEETSMNQVLSKKQDILKSKRDKLEKVMKEKHNHAKFYPLNKQEKMARKQSKEVKEFKEESIDESEIESKALAEFDLDNTTYYYSSPTTYYYYSTDGSGGGSSGDSYGSYGAGSTTDDYIATQYSSGNSKAVDNANIFKIGRVAAEKLNFYNRTTPYFVPNKKGAIAPACSRSPPFGCSDGDIALSNTAHSAIIDTIFQDPGADWSTDFEKICSDTETTAFGPGGCAMFAIEVFTCVCC